MSGKTWLGLLLAALALVFAVWGGVNVCVDPFNAFGDRLMGWDAYTQTLNPRNSKAAYVAQRFDQFDSYVIGSSSAASYLPETLNGYLDASFYNLFHYGADPEYDAQLVSWLLENDDVRYIFLVLGLNEANAAGTADGGLTDKTHYQISGESKWSYYGDFLFASPSYAWEKVTSRARDTELPQVFDVFLPESGVYDKRLRDVESIGEAQAYLEKNGADFPTSGGEMTLEQIDRCAEYVGRIRRMCQAAGTELIVVLSPVSESQLGAYTQETLSEYFEALAAVTGYWNFAISPVTWDPRYFYDSTHTRNAVGDMVLGRIFGDAGQYYPDSFGVYCREGEAVRAQELTAAARESAAQQESVTVPILLYHHLSQEGEESGTVLRPETFARQMALLKENGYETVTFDDLIAYVETGAALPEKSVIITFDDGYWSNYQYAFPILQQYAYRAAIFVIGSSVGHERYYKDTQYELTPHFGREEIEEMTASGLITIASHTYDMHQWAPFETGDAVRETIVPLEGESEEDYIAALTRDVELQDRLFQELGLEPSRVLAFPSGQYTPLTDVVLAQCGFRVTVTTDAGRVNTLMPGLPQSLIDLGRMNVDGSTTDEEILAYLSMGA